VAKQTRSAVFAIRKETTEGTYIAISAATQFTVLRDGFSFQSGVETVDSDELVNDIGASEGFVSRESPSASIPKYFKHSGVEGQAPDWSVLMESAIGSVATHGTEHFTAASSTAGTSAVRALIKGDSGTGADAPVGKAVLIKDGTNGYSIRNVQAVSTNDLSLNFNLSAAPGTTVGLGKAIHFVPVATGHPTYTAHLYQASSSSALHQAMTGCRTTGMQIEFPANDLAQITFDIEGIGYYMNPITISASNKSIDFDIGASALLATLTEKTYKSPKDLAREIATKMSAISGATISCSYGTNGKFTISKAAGTLGLDFATGPNLATSAAVTLGYAATDLSGSLTYTSTTAQTYSPSYTPTFDDNGATIVRYNELLIGSYDRTDNRQASNVSMSVSTPKTDVEDLTAETGVSESVVLEREVTLSCTLVFKEHDVEQLDNLLNNTTQSVMFNHGPKSNGNWVAGKCVNCYMPNAKVTSNVIADQDGLVIVECEFKGFVSTSQKDVHINLV